MNNLEYKHKLLLLSSAALLTACTSEVAETEPVSEAPKCLNVAWGTFAQSTRTTDVDAWEMYDQIGISMLYHHPALHAESERYEGVYYDAVMGTVPFNSCYYTTSAGSSEFTYFSPQHRIWFPTDTTTVDFVAYYPYLGELSLQQHLYPVDLGKQATDGKRLTDYDLMWGSVHNLDKGNTSVVIPFSHQLTKVVCYIKPAGDLTFAELQQATVSISHQKTTAQMDVLTSALQYGNEDADVQLITSAVVVDGDSCLEAKAMLLPNHALQNPVAYTATDDRQESMDKNRHILLYLPSLEGHPLCANIKETEFNPGQKHVFRLEAKISQLNLLSGEIVEWETVEHNDVTIIE